MQKIGHKTFTVTASGADGSATGSNTTPFGAISGELISVHLAYSAGMPATCDVVLTRVADGAIPAETLLTVSNNNTDGWYYPRAIAVTSANTNIAGAYSRFGLANHVQAAIAQGNDIETVTVTILYASD
jgi:hypothetical protein